MQWFQSNAIPNKCYSKQMLAKSMIDKFFSQKESDQECNFSLQWQFLWRYKIVLIALLYFFTQSPKLAPNFGMELV
jgi:hypothetical protein